MPLAPTRLVRAPAVLLAAIGALTLVIYLRAGVAGAYLASDDFQWLLGGLAFDWTRLADISSRGHFYRPVTELWFAAWVGACSTATECYHLANLGLHLLNVSLVLAVGWRLSARASFAALGALVFAVQPAYVQAVVWVSAATGLLGASWFLLSLLFQIEAARHDRSPGLELAAVVAFAAAVFSHEAAITLPLVSWALHRTCRERRRPLPIVRAGFFLVLGVFAVAAFLANRRNYVFTEGYYRAGTHMIRHGLDYLVALPVAPRWWLNYVLAAIGVGAALRWTPLARFGAAWMLITCVPYVGFTWTNASRYLYLPAIGFAWVVAEAIVEGRALAAARSARWRPAVNGAFWVLAVFVVVRFGSFTMKSLRGEVAWLETTRTYLMKIAPGAPAVAPPSRVPAPESPYVERQYVEPMLRWVYQDQTLEVQVERAASSPAR